MSNLMKQESVDTLYDYINHLNKSYSQSLGAKASPYNIYPQHRDDLVKEVQLFDGDSSSNSGSRNGNVKGLNIYRDMCMSRAS